MSVTVSAEIRNALEIVWPSNAGPEVAVKRAAAEYLLANHSLGSLVKAVLVASHVTTTVGKVSSLGITKKFEQLLIEDPCFNIDKQHSNTLVALDTIQLLSQASWRQDEQLVVDQQRQQQWQQPPPPQQPQQLGSPPGLGSSHSSSTGGVPCLKATPRLLQGLNELWPRTGPAATAETKAKHAALFQLLNRPQNTMEWFALAFAVNEALGCVDIVQDMGCVLPLHQLLQQEPSIFVFEQSARGSPMPAVALDRQGVLQMFVRRHSTSASPHDLQPLLPQPQPLQPQPLQQHVGDSLQGVAPDSGVVSAAALLQYVRSRQWHSSDPVLDAVRRALAERMVLKVNTAAAKEGQQPARSEAKWYNMLGSLAGYTIAQALEGLGPAAARSPPSLEECVDQDPYLSIYFAGDVQHIKLDIEQLLQDAAAAAVAVVIPPQLQDRQQLSGAAAAAGSSILQQVGPTFSDAAAAGASSSRQSDGWPAVNGANSSTAHAAAAARGAQEVSVSALLQHVGSRVWHSSNLQLDLARRILAEHLVTKANEGVEPHCPAHSDAEAYREDFSKSGIALNKALRSRFGASPPACYKKFAEVFSDDSCWQIIPPSTPGGQMLAQLNLPLLLHEAAALQDATAGIPFKHNSNSSSSHCSAVRAASSAADAPAAAARAGSAVAVLRLAGDAADGASSSQQAAGWPAVHGASTSTAHATRGVQQVSAGTLLQHVSSRVWHSNLQLDLARRALAQHLVAKANEGVEAHCPANSDVELYRERFAQAGDVIIRALRSRFGKSVQPYYNKLAEVFSDDACWRVLAPSSLGSQKQVQLNVLLLLQEAAALQNSASGIGSNSSPGSAVQAAAGAPAAAATRPGSGAASSSSGIRPVAVKSPAVASAGAATSAEAAMAAIKAAARSLMPPAVKASAANAAPAASSPATSAAAVDAADTDVAGGSSSRTSTPMAAAAQPNTGMGAAVAGDTGIAATAALQNPFLPIWMRGIGAGAAPAAAEPVPQQQEPQEAAATAAQQLLDSPAELLPSTAAAVSEGVAVQPGPLSVTSAGPRDPSHWMTPAVATPTEQQLNGTASMQATTTAAAAPSSSSNGLEQRQETEVPLQYELVLSNSVPGWYTASYLPHDSTADAAGAAAGACSTAQGAACSNAEHAQPAAATGTAAGSSSSSSLCSPVARHDQTDSPGRVTVDLTSSQCEALAAAIVNGAAEQISASFDAATAALAVDGGSAGRPQQQEQQQAEQQEQQQQQCDQDLLVVLEAVPVRLRVRLQPYLAAGPDKPHVTHIILDSGRAVTLRLSNRTSVQLDIDVTLGDALQHLLTKQQQWAGQQWPGSSSAVATGYQQNGTSDSSRGLAAVNGGLSAPTGYISSNISGANGCPAVAEVAPAVAAAGPRPFEGDCQAAACQLFGPGLASCLGLPGSCHRVCVVQDAAGRVCGVTYCLQSVVPGAAGGLADVLSGMKASLSPQGGMDRPRSLLVLGRPGVGKACLLRDVCRLVSSTPAQGGLGLHVMMLDTTGDLAGLHSQPTPHIGAARVVPVPDRSQQAHTMARIARSHQPDVLVVGELATQQEAAAAVSITRSCNVLLVAAAPASSLRMLLQDSMLCHLVGCERLERGGMQRTLPCPFSIAVELLGKDMCCVHTDLEASSDDLMLQLSSGNKKGSQGHSAKKAETAPNVHAQLRSRDSSGRLVVQFGSAAAAGAALADAAIVEVIAQSSAVDV